MKANLMAGYSVDLKHLDENWGWSWAVMKVPTKDLSSVAMRVTKKVGLKCLGFHWVVMMA